MISVAENSNKFQKIRFWKEKSVENVVTLESLPFNSSMISSHIWLLKNQYIHCKTMFTCWVSLIEEEALCDFQGFWMLVRPRRSSLSEISSEILRLENSVSSTIPLWVLPACLLLEIRWQKGRQADKICTCLPIFWAAPSNFLCLPSRQFVKNKFHTWEAPILVACP